MPLHRLSASASRRGLVLLSATALLATPLALLGGTPATAGAPASALAEPAAIVSTGPLRLENSFVSSVGWVKPGQRFPSRLLVTNTGTSPLSGVRVDATAPTGVTFSSAVGATVAPTAVAWAVGVLPAGQTRTLVLESQTATTAQDPRVVWKNIASTATASATGLAATAPARSHGPKVIPADPSGSYDSARYGDRPFPVVPVEFADRKYNGGTPANPVPAVGGDGPNTAEALAEAINSKANKGSTFNLYQEMSYGQLFPQGTVPALGKTEAFGVQATKAFTQPSAPAGTCTGVTPGTGSGMRVVDGKYQLPGTTEYYGRDKYGSNVAASVSGVGAIGDIDGGCGPTAKSVYDAATIADPDIDYSDYDTDKDGVVDFFMMVFAGCGGNGGSQLAATGACPDQLSGSYDNIWPHSSDLQGTYSDPVTGLKGYVSQDQLKDLEGRPLWYTDTSRSTTTTTDKGDALKVFVRVGPYNVNPETAIDKASVISHEYGHSLGLPDFYSLGSRETYGDWNLMATDHSQFMDVYSRQRLGWVVPDVLAPGTTTSTTMRDGKIDTQRIAWQRPDGTAYELSPGGGDQGVHNGQAYVAKLPGRKLLDESILTAAQGNRLWHSGSGNDFGCSPGKGHNFDISLPGAEQLPAGTKITADFDSAWQIEWDFDYGFVLAGGRDAAGKLSLASVPSAKGYSTKNTQNPNQSGCLTALDNGLTGNSASYAEGEPTITADRTQGTVKPLKFVPDSYDLSSLAGKRGAFLRLSYNTDPGLARAGWFIDNMKITATPPGGTPVPLFTQDFEDPATGGQDGQGIFNGGCKDNLATADTCTTGWNYVGRGFTNAADHAYYLEMRDRSGFDNNGRGEDDRTGIAFQPGLYLSYTDEAHGDGNVGTDNPPAQSPLDSVPTVGSDAPNLNDAAFTDAATRSVFTDVPDPVTKRGRFDNYSDPGRAPTTAGGSTRPWEFDFSCLTFKVTSLSGTAAKDELPGEPGADVLTGNVDLTAGKGCAAFDYRASSTAASPSPSATAGTGTPASPGPGGAASPSPSTSTSASPAPSSSSPSVVPAACGAPAVVQLSRSTMVSGQAVTARVNGTPGALVDLVAYTRPSTTYRVVRTLRLGDDGLASTSLVPPSNTRTYAQERGCAKGGSTAVTVRASVSLDARRTGTRTYVFRGNSLPKRAGGLPVAVYRRDAAGREVLVARARSNGRTGAWSLTRRFTGTGRFTFVARIAQDSSNAAAVSAGRSISVR